jgi:site-specific DNA-methyltransferase (adenine-specific)/site-specific DNA-methyltransferase (cytosine-N4-specific)
MQKYPVQLGDVWSVGDHRYICGDATVLDTWVTGLSEDGRSLPNPTAAYNGVITSPPYANQRKEEYGGVHELDYVDWWDKIQACAKATLAPDGSFLLNIKAHSSEGQRSLYVMELVLAMANRYGWSYIDEFCWLRNPAPGNWPNRFKNGFEPVFHFGLTPWVKFRPDSVLTESKGARVSGQNRSMGNYYNADKKFIDWSEGSRPSNVVHPGGNATGFQHPAAFPVGMPMFFIQALSDPGDLWIDPFSGSGSVAVAAHRAVRRSVSIEIVPEFVAVSLLRMENETGVEAVKIGGF